ncbi:lantibiotic dehydratase family protein [Flavobacterium sp. Arc3]|uniref:lantibiotic dehydratase family protein n=1 Tax=Flavobacterium sp. Arc3 TaxID=3046686 RepID=UPI00352E09DD
MPKSEINYSFFSSFIIRTPLYPIDFYSNLTNGLSIESDAIKEVLKETQVNEALFLASPELYSEIQKWMTHKDRPIDKEKKIKLSVLKYLIRMSTRCTPFGLFAACGSGKLAYETNININSNFNSDCYIDKKNSFCRKTRFDMQFLANLSSELALNPTIQNQLLFYPNTTLYQLGDFYRYVEYALHQKKRKYSLEALKRTDYLDLILQKAIVGVRKKELATFLVSEEISIEVAIEFIEELIFNQILVSEFEPILTGKDFHPTTFSKEEGAEILNNKVGNFTRVLDDLNKQLLKIDTKFGNPISCYEDIIETVVKTKIPFDKKYLFQTDLFLDSKDFQLDNKYISELLRAIDMLNKISEKPKNTALENFKKVFAERYESEAIPLVKALDVETGIGYLQNKNGFDFTPVLDSIGINQKESIDNHLVSLNEVGKIIYSKLQNTLLNNENNIVLNYSDFESIQFQKENLPNTFSCLFEIVEEHEKEWIVIQSIGGSSAANLLARFCYGNTGINDLANEITQYESESYFDKILAEIVHLPESRTGNVLRRPSFRPYEIPYLGQSSLPISHQINIEDLIVYVKNDRLVLWSKKQDKEVIPRLTNAHNYSYNALPIYHFLCDMQFENCKSTIGFHWNSFEKLFDYLPRVTVGNCIVSKAKWIFNKNRYPEFFKIFNNKTPVSPDLFRSIILSLGVRGLRYVSLIDDDNTLLINLENDTCVEMLVEAVKNKTQFVLEEFLFPSSKVITGNSGCYANQFIVGLKKNKD